MPLKEYKKVKSSVTIVEAPVVDRATEKRKEVLITKIREGMPSVPEMKAQGFGVTRRALEHQRRVRPYIDELEKIEGHPVSIERYRPG